MKDLKELFDRIHERSLWQVLGVYLAGGWVALEVISTFQEEALLPEWVFRLALVLLLIGLPIVLITAYVQKGVHGRPAAEREGIGRIFTWRHALWGGVGAFALWGVVAAAWLLSGGRTMAPTAASDELAGIAVLPFQTDASGEDLAAWSEGIPSLLATNLDGVGGLRKVDPRSVHTLWRRELGRETVDRDALLDLARRVGASYAVTGGVVEASNRAVLTAEVYRVADGGPSGPPVRVDGPVDSLLALVDRLSVEILRAGLIPADAELPPFDLTRATTSSLQALRAFLKGEVDYRRARFREAIEHFNEAVEIDPAFPLALYRLATSHAWEGAVDLSMEYAARALEQADRLPRREALLLRAYHRLSMGEKAAIEALEDYTKRYPDDVEGWFLLGDAYYHIGAPGLVPLRRFREATGEAIDRNPYFGPPYIHLIDHAFHRGDRRAVLELVDRYAEIDRDTDWCIGYEVAASLAYGDEDRKRRTVAALDTVSGDPLSCAQRALAMTPATWEPFEVVWKEQVSRESFEPPFRADARFWRAAAVAQRGRIRESVDWREELFEGRPAPPSIRYDLIWYLTGYEDERVREWAEWLERSPDKGPLGHVLLALLAGDEDRRDDAEAHVRSLRAVADSLRSVSDTARVDGRSADGLSAAADATLASLDLRRALDSEEALERAMGALFDPSLGEPALTGVLRYDIGRALVERGRFEEARRYFESFVWTERWYTTPKEYWLGRVHEGLGNLERARGHYGKFVTWWEEADPRFHEWREEARARLSGLLEAPATR